MRIIQLLDSDQKSRLAFRSSAEDFQVIEGELKLFSFLRTQLAEQNDVSASESSSLERILNESKVECSLSAEELKEEKVFRLDSPFRFEDPRNVTVTGTGLTHMGSADARDKMHASDPDSLTDSMKIFKLGLEGGRPPQGEVGVQPEWFYKGDGSALVSSGEDIESPAFALDHGEEPEVVGIYINDPQGIPRRLGYALGNEFSDHVMERQNYLYLAHSKIRPCAIGPEILLGELPSDIRGVSRIYRGEEIHWEKPFISGEENMCHSFRNLEWHHFKYSQFRRPSDVHVHFFGTQTLSFADGIQLQDGDVMEMESEAFGLPLRNRLRVDEGPVKAFTVRAL